CGTAYENNDAERNISTISMTKFRGAKVLVVGANGFLGKHLLGRLGKEDAKIHAVSRNAQPSDTEVTWWKGSAADSCWIGELVARIEPDVIYQLASASLGGQDLKFLL